MISRLLTLAVPFALVVAMLPASPAATPQKDWYERAVKKLEAKFDPAEAKPGQTVTFKLTIQLNDGYNTYPTAQPDKMATGMNNILKFPDPGTVVFVGKTLDPEDYLTKAEPELGIKELRYNVGTVVFTRKAVVSPKAAAGAAKVKVPGFKLLVCDKNTCFPPKSIDLEAPLKVFDGSVPVEKEFADEVAKALAGK